MKINFNLNKFNKFLAINYHKIYHLLMLFFILSVFCPSLFSHELDVFLKHEKNEYYANAIKHKNFTAQREFESGENLIKAFDIEGGSHLGVLYLKIENRQHKLRHYRLDIGPVYDIITSKTLPYLNENQILVISATGGSSLHHVYGIVINIKEDNLKTKSIIPLYGHSVPLGLNCAWRYKIKGYDYDKDKKVMTLTYDSFFDNPSSKDIKTLKERFNFKSLDDKFEVVIAEESICTWKASESIIDTLPINMCTIGREIDILKLTP
ncbi:MAG: hypothetical protein ACRYGR_07765 [Janthinobacterium lividum]